MSKFNAAFWKWFGDSKVVDSKGNPLVVYHGTDSELFHVFDLNKAGIRTGSQEDSDFGMWGRGFYFTPTKKWAYGDKMIAAYLSIQNPLIIFSDDDWSEKLRPVRGRRASDELRSRILDMNHDGVIHYERNPNRPNYDHPSERIRKRPFQIVAFFSEQIKSINNDGTWDADDPDIRSNPEDFGESEDIFSDAWMERLELAISQSVAKILNDAGDAYVVHLKRKDGSQLFVSQTSNSGKNAWQVSWVDKNDIPSMDTLFKTREAALISIAGGGPSPSIGQPGEWKIIETRKRR